MLIYNKEFQQIILIDINDYKNISGKYKIIAKNGKGKEFNFKGKIIFEGEYLNGKRNGQGKEFDYDDDNLQFKGEYLNGKRNGLGKEYNNNNGKLIFEGEYLNGKKWTGKGYNYFGKLVYEIVNGKGYIKEYKKEGKFIFEGEYLNGERNGKGKEYNYDGNLILKANI